MQRGPHALAHVTCPFHGRYKCTVQTLPSHITCPNLGACKRLMDSTLQAAEARDLWTVQLPCPEQDPGPTPVHEARQPSSQGS